MGINLPQNPYFNQIYRYHDDFVDHSWIWDGEKWKDFTSNDYGVIYLKNNSTDTDDVAILLTNYDSSGNTTAAIFADGTISGKTYYGDGSNLTGISGGGFSTSGGTFTGPVIFISGLTANTISATTYFNLPTDVRVTGGTYSNGTATFTNNTGGTFNVTGFVTSSNLGNYLPLSGGTMTGGIIANSGLTANTISATTYLNLPLDIRTTGATYSNGTATFTNNNSTTYTLTGLTLPFTGGTVNGLTANTISATTYLNLPLDIDSFLPLSGGSLTGPLSGTSISATTFYGNGSGLTNFTSNQITTALGYTPYNSTNPSGYITGYTDTYTTGGTYSNGIINIKNNLGNSFNIEGLYTGTTDFYVPYSGANNDVHLGTREIYTGKLWLYDEAEGESGSLHYADEALHFENSEGETLIYIEPGFVQLHNGQNIQSNLFTTLLTQIRNHYLPDIDGTIALTANTLSGYGITDAYPLNSNPRGYLTAYTNTYTTGGTYSNGSAVFTNNSGGTFTVNGFTTPFTGGSVTGATNFTNGLTANTISATTYLNLPTGQYLPLSGGTLTGTLSVPIISATTYQGNLVNSISTSTGLSGSSSNGNVTLINTSPDRTVTLTGSTYISISGTYPNFGINTQNLPDTFTTGFTYTPVNNTFAIKRNQGQPDLTATISIVSGLTVNNQIITIISGNTASINSGLLVNQIANGGGNSGTTVSKVRIWSDNTYSTGEGRGNITIYNGTYNTNQSMNLTVDSGNSIISASGTLVLNASGSFQSPSLTQQVKLYPTGNMVINGSADAGYKLDVNGTTRLNGKNTFTGSITASANLAQANLVTSTLVAAANNDVLVGLDVVPTFSNPSGYTGVTNYSARFGGDTYFTYAATRTISVEKNITTGTGAALTIQAGTAFSNGGGGTLNLYQGAGVGGPGVGSVNIGLTTGNMSNPALIKLNGGTRVTSGGGYVGTMFAVNNTGSDMLSFYYDQVNAIVANIYASSWQGQFTSANSYVFDNNVGIGQLTNPDAPTLTPSATGGTLTAATYYYKIVAVDVNGKTTGNGTEANTTTTGTTSSVGLTWTAIIGAYSYRIYQGIVTNTQTKYFTSTTNSATDIGSGYTVTAIPNVSANTSAKSWINGSGLVIPSLTTTNVNAWSNPITGQRVYDNTLNINKFYNSTAWDTLGSLAATQIWSGVNTFNNTNGIVMGSYSPIYWGSVGFGAYITSNGYYLSNILRQTGQGGLYVGVGSNATASQSIELTPSLTTNWDMMFRGPSQANIDLTIRNSNTIMGRLFSTNRWYIGPTPTDDGSTRLNVEGAVKATSFNPNSPQTTLSGSTSGNAVFSMPFQGSSYKKVIVYCNALLGVTNTYTFPTAFSFTPAIVTTNGLSGSIITTLTSTTMVVTGAPSTGFLILEGY